MSNILTQPVTWKQQLGYLPVPLFGIEAENRFVLLNGGKGNFCLDINSNNDNIQDANALAWSADVDHYVAIKGNEISLSRWDKPGHKETYSINDILNRLPLFQQYLETHQAPRERSIVSHAIGSYRTIRAKGSNKDQNQSLMAFLAVLVKAWEHQQPNLTLCNIWSETANAQAALEDSFSKSDIEVLIEQLVKPLAYTGITPNMDLLIRHAAGRIFQEAHYLALIPRQSDLFLGAQATPLRPASKSLGAFFTPTPLVRTVVEQAIKHLDIASLKNIHILDPACGSGEFLREALRQLELSGFDGKVQITGYDISEPACHMARFILAAESIKWGRRIQISIVQRDALNQEPWPESVNLCLMNPPFLAWPDLNGDQKEIITQLLGDLSSKRPDMAMAFLLLASKSLESNGVIGTVIPASILDGASAQPLREYIETQLNISLIARLGSQEVFADVIVDPALFVAVNRSKSNLPKSNITQLVWADHNPRSSEVALRTLRRLDTNSLDDNDIGDDHFSIYNVSNDILKNNWAPRPFKSAQLLATLTHAPKVQKLFSVQQGTLTGMNSVFLLKNTEFQALPKQEHKFFRPCIMNSSIRNGMLMTDTWVFYPYSEGLPSLGSEQDLAKNLKVYYETWLLPNREALKKRARIKPDFWWRLSEYRNWQVQPSMKIVSTYFGGAGSFALDRIGNFVVVQGYGWLPKSILMKDNEQHALAMLAILNSDITNELLAGVSNNVAGGQWNLSKRFVEKMPIVDVRNLGQDLLDILTSFGLAMSEGVEFDKTQLFLLAKRAIISQHTSIS